MDIKPCVLTGVHEIANNFIAQQLFPEQHKHIKWERTFLKNNTFEASTLFFKRVCVAEVHRTLLNSSEVEFTLKLTFEGESLLKSKKFKCSYSIPLNSLDTEEDLSMVYLGDFEDRSLALVKKEMLNLKSSKIYELLEGWF